MTIYDIYDNPIHGVTAQMAFMIDYVYWECGDYWVVGSQSHSGSIAVRWVHRGN